MSSRVIELEMSEPFLKNHLHPSIERTSWRMILLAMSLGVLSSAVVASWLRPSPTASPSPFPPSFQDLQRANAYIGLDKLPFPKSLEGKEILNFPLTIGRVTSDNPNFVVPVETPDFPSSEGVVFPDVREILISPTISTVAEVRVVDFGMERCHVAIMLLSTPALPSSNDSDLHFSDGGASIQVFRLEAERPLNLIPNSKDAMPRRKESLGLLEAEVGSIVNTTSFHCTSGSLEQFEFVCATPSCYLRLRQDPGIRGLGVVVVQLPSQ